MDILYLKFVDELITNVLASMYVKAPGAAQFAIPQLLVSKASSSRRVPHNYTWIQGDQLCLRAMGVCMWKFSIDTTSDNCKPQNQEPH